MGCAQSSRAQVTPVTKEPPHWSDEYVVESFVGKEVYRVTPYRCSNLERRWNIQPDTECHTVTPGAAGAGAAGAGAGAGADRDAGSESGVSQATGVDFPLVLKELDSLHEVQVQTALSKAQGDACHVPHVVEAIGGALIMEYCGVDLWHAVQQDTLSMEELWCVGAQLVQHVAWLSTQGCVHLDLAPQNVAISSKGNGHTATLIDFGAALNNLPQWWVGLGVPSRMAFGAMHQHRRCEGPCHTVDLATLVDFTDELESLGWVLFDCICELHGCTSAVGAAVGSGKDPFTIVPDLTPRELRCLAAKTKILKSMSDEAALAECATVSGSKDVASALAPLAGYFDQVAKIAARRRTEFEQLVTALGVPRSGIAMYDSTPAPPALTKADIQAVLQTLPIIPCCEL